MEVSAFPFLNQEDYNNFYTLFSETDENLSKKRPKLENESLLPALLFLDEEQNLNQAQSMDEFFDTYQTGIERETSPGSTGSGSYHFQSVAGSSGQIQFQNLTSDNKTETEEIRRASKRARSEIRDETETVPGQTGQQHRRLWVKNRSKAWWEEVNRPDYPEHEFVNAFRMSKATFEMICNELDSAVNKKDTMLRLAIPVRQRVAVCIYRLATGEPLRLVSKRFGLGISTCHKLVLEVCSAIKTVLMPKFLQWPDESRMTETKKKFNEFSGLPNVGGSVYTTHIPIIAPKISVAAYFNKKHTERNQKTSYSITVQGVVDSNGIFTDVCIGWPGSMSDEKILEKSALFQRANRGVLKDVWMVGNSGYPLMDWVLTPYNHQNLTWAQHGLNERIGQVQKVAKDAFGRLKGRWSCLQKRTEVKLQDLPVVLGACCVLHNICEMRRENVDGEMMFEVFDDEMMPENGIRSVGAMQARDQIAHHLLHHNSFPGIAGL